MERDEVMQVDPNEYQVVWIPKAPEGALFFRYANTMRGAAQEAFLDCREESWEYYYRRGYRMVKVELREFT